MKGWSGDGQFVDLFHQCPTCKKRLPLPKYAGKRCPKCGTIQLDSRLPDPNRSVKDEDYKIEEKPGYNVVFEYTERVDSHQGVRTWTTYKNREEFQKFYTSERAERERVIAEGVSNKRAIELCSTPEVTQASMASMLRKIDELLHQL